MGLKIHSFKVIEPFEMGPLVRYFQKNLPFHKELFNVDFNMISDVDGSDLCRSSTAQ